jgi:hypothetical protein
MVGAWVEACAIVYKYDTSDIFRIGVDNVSGVAVAFS